MAALTENLPGFPKFLSFYKKNRTFWSNWLFQKNDNVKFISINVFYGSFSLKQIKAIHFYFNKCSSKEYYITFTNDSSARHFNDFLN